MLPCHGYYSPKTWLIDVTAYQGGVAKASVVIKATTTGAYHLTLPVGTYTLRTRYWLTDAAPYYPMGSATITARRAATVNFSPGCA